jgi:hypothetical protein
LAVVGDGSTPLPTTVAAMPVGDGGIPAPPAQTTLPLSSAPALGTINYLPNRSSVLLYLPGVTGARDYRVFAVESGVSVSVNSTNQEHVNGATISCSGLRQRNQCCDDEILPITYNNPLLDMPLCEGYGDLARRPNVPEELTQTVEIDGVAPNTTLVVEAIDRQCPFPGLFGSTHMDVPIAAGALGPPTVSVVVNNNPYTLQLIPATFPLQTEAEIRAQYGSMIFNGQGPNQPTLDPTSPAFPESPYIRLAQPAPADDPVVLSRSVVSVSPTGTSTLPEGFSATDFFDDFSDDTDQPVLLRTTDPANAILGVGTPINVYETKNWVLYDIANQFSNFFIDRGQLDMSMGDAYQGAMTTQAIYPRGRPFQLPTADTYLHVTYEVERNETPRRYENLALCGSDTIGQTYTGDTLAAAPYPQPGFMNEIGTTPTNVLGWNCLTLVGRGAGYGVLPGGDIVSHADTSLKITVVRTHPAPAPGEYRAVTLDPYTTAYGPSQEPDFYLLWERQIDDSGNPVGVWLDDQMHIWQRTRFDVYINRSQVVEYVAGQQRICQNLDPTAITMAEAAVGFWHILYHTSAEFVEIRQDGESDNPSTDQHHVMHNTPFADERSYDNVGIQENVALPAAFDSALCFTADPPDAGQ